jgi:glycosyltransferase involved in cell wall biosynthesis
MKISVIIPTFNMCATLPGAIDSALYQADEVIVVDDGSTDDTRVNLISLIGTPKLRIFNSKSNQGVCSSRNFAIITSDCDWFVPLDADDWLERGAIDALRQAADSRTFAYGDWIETEDGQPVRKSASPIGMLDRKNVAKATFLFSRAMWQSVGGYDADFEQTGGEDWAFMCALVQAGYRAAKVDTAIYHYTHRSDGRAARVVEHAGEVMALLKAKYPGVFHAQLQDRQPAPVADPR